MTNDEINEQTPEAPATSQESTTSPMLEQEAVMGYDEQIAALKAAAAAVNQETPEQKKKRERMEKSKKVIAATVDGLSALSNLFFTTQYAPNAYNPQSSQLGKVNERIEALKAERKADADRYNNYMLRLGDAQNAKAKTIRDMRAQHEAQKLAREKAERDAEAHSWQALLQPDKQREQKGKADRAGHQAAAAAVDAAYAPQMNEAKIQTEHAKAGAHKAAATNSMAQAEKGFYGTFDGKRYRTKADYDKAVMVAAREYNARNPRTERKTRKVMDEKGNPVKGEDGSYEVEEYDAPVDVVPIRWSKKTADGEEPRFYDAAVIASELEPLLRSEREAAKPQPNKGKGYGEGTGKGRGY